MKSTNMFPEKWCVRGPLNQTLKNFFDRSVPGELRSYGMFDDFFFHYPSTNLCVTSEYVIGGYTLIDKDIALIIVELIKQNKL